MVDSIDIGSSSELNNLAELLSEKVNKRILLDLESNSKLSEAEMRFLSLSKEKAQSNKIIENLINRELTLKNFEDIFCLKEFSAIGGTINPEQAVRNVRYKDARGTVVATVQIDTLNKKIRMQNLGDVLPKQECFTPSHVGTKLRNLAKFKKWSTEDGGVNQFNGNIEYRYKDENGNVMAAIITKPDGTFDTIAEYEYKNGHKSQMLLTNHFGQSRVIYDGSSSVNQITRIDIDTDGTIVELTKVYNE